MTDSRSKALLSPEQKARTLSGLQTLMDAERMWLYDDKGTPIVSVEFVHRLLEDQPTVPFVTSTDAMDKGNEA